MAEIVNRIRPQRLLEPADVIVPEHLRRAHRPLQPVRPVGITRPGINEQLVRWPRRLPRRPHDRLVHRRTVPPPKRPPADLERPEPLGPILRHHLAHQSRLFHQQRAIRQRPPGISAAKQPPHRHPGRLAEDVPQRDVNATDAMGKTPAPPHPERILVQLLRNPLRLQRALAPPQRLQHLHARLHQPAIGEHAAIPDDPGIGVHGDQRVDRILRPDLGRPAALRTLPEQRGDSDVGDTDRRQRGLRHDGSSCGPQPRRSPCPGARLH